MLRIGLPVALVAALLAGCAGPGATGSGPSPSVGATIGQSAAESAWPTASPTGSTSSVAPLPALPDGFPVHPSMVERMPEPRFIASWTSDAMPSEIYDYYLAELVAAGFVIDVEGPGGEVAVIRFHTPDGTPYQLDLKGYYRQPVEVDLGPPHP